MFGYLRFILAAAVVASHLDIYFKKLHQGWMAVFCFYILAGLVSSKLYYKVFDSKPWPYIKDRLLRIYPMALVWLGLSFLILGLAYPEQISISASKVIASLSLIPLSYATIFHFVTLPGQTVGMDFIFPQYFSLGLELQIYACLALLFWVKKFWLTRIVAIVSLVQYTVIILVPLGLDRQMTVNFSYSVFFSTLWVFYLGILIYRERYKELIYWWSFCLAVTVFQFAAQFGLGSSPHTMIAVILGLPVIAIIARFEKKYPEHRLKFNGFFGSMSFIVYCNHYLVIFVYKNIAGYNPSFWQALAISFVIGLPTYWLIEKPLNKKRAVKPAL